MDAGRRASLAPPARPQARPRAPPPQLRRCPAGAGGAAVPVCGARGVRRERRANVRGRRCARRAHELASDGARRTTRAGHGGRHHTAPDELFSGLAAAWLAAAAHVSEAKRRPAAGATLCGGDSAAPAARPRHPQQQAPTMHCPRSAVLAALSSSLCAQQHATTAAAAAKTAAAAAAQRSALALLLASPAVTRQLPWHCVRAAFSAFAAPHVAADAADAADAHRGRARVLDGRAVAAAWSAELQQQVPAISRALNRRPALAVVLVGSRPDSCVYVARKQQAARCVRGAAAAAAAPAHRAQRAERPARA